MGLQIIIINLCKMKQKTTDDKTMMYRVVLNLYRQMLQVQIDQSPPRRAR